MCSRGFFGEEGGGGNLCSLRSRLLCTLCKPKVFRKPVCVRVCVRARFQVGVPQLSLLSQPTPAHLEISAGRMLTENSHAPRVTDPQLAAGRAHRGKRSGQLPEAAAPQLVQQLAIGP